MNTIFTHQGVNFASSALNLVLVRKCKAGVGFSGCTVHLVNDEYDKGPIVVQRSIAVEPGETPETLASRVFEEECIAYPEALRLCLSGRLRLENNQVVITDAESD